MTKSKKIHPADAADRAAIDGAVRFNVHLRISPTKKINREAATLAEAVSLFDEMKVIPSAGRLPIVYAIMPTEATIPVPADMIEAARAQEPVETVSYAINEGTNSAGEPSATAAASADLSEEEIPAFLKRDRLASIVEVAPVVVSVEEIKAAPTVPTARRGRFAEAFAAAERGEMPTAPDFSKPTHARFRAKLEALVKMVEAGDVAAVEAFHETYKVEPLSDSRKAILRYRDLALTALRARAAKHAA